MLSIILFYFELGTDNLGFILVGGGAGVFLTA